MNLTQLLPVLLLATGCFLPAFAQSRFSARDLRGTYVFSFQGTLVNTQTAQPIPIAALGTMTFDGEGKVTRAIRHLNLGGQIVRASATGTYTMTADGLGTATFTVVPMEGEPPIVPPTQEVFLFVMKNRQIAFAISASIRAANGENIGLVAISRADIVRQEEP